MKYPETESSTLEFKREMPTNQQVTKAVLGFCNQHGGKLLIGVSDDGTIIGVPEAEVDIMIAKVAHVIFSSCHPPILPLVYSQRIHDKMIIIIEVAIGPYKPYFLKDKGVNEGTYVRLGSTTVLANAEIIHELQWLAGGHAADDLIVYNANIDNLDLPEALDLLGNHSHSKQREDASLELLKGYGLIVEEHKNYYPTISGVLLFCKNPQVFLSEAFIICSHFAGVSGREVIATRDCEGTLFQQFTDAYAWILSRINRSFTIRGAKREERYELPEEAIREALINAIVHRNYQHKSPIKIAIYDDRIEIYSPGNFPGPLKTDQLEYGFTYMRNPTICRLFRKKGLMEKLGSGFTIIFEKYRQWGLAKPIVIEATGFVKCILPRPTPQNVYDIPIENQEAKILRLLQVSQEIVSSDVGKDLSISKPTAIRILNEMKAKGLIERVGSGPTTRYRVVRKDMF